MQSSFDKRIVFRLVLTVLLALPVLAQEQTGSITGIVMDETGGVLPGVTVELTGPNLPGGARVQTDANGRYRFPSVPPGDYVVTARLEGFVPSVSSNVRVALGQTPKVDHTMRISGVAETLTVSAEAPLVDVTRSATATSIQSETFSRLPKGRTFTSVATFAAGANQEDKAGGIAIEGASGSENRFIIDGIDTTDLQTGESGKSVITDFIEEVQVKSAGYAAEFGGATGGVISVITKTGSNDFSGDVGAYYTPSPANAPYFGDERPFLDKDNAGNATYFNFEEDDFTRLEPGFTLGGPILKDRLWFFAGYQPTLIEQDRRVEFTSGVTNEYGFDREIHYGTANLSGNVGSRVNYKLAANFNPSEDTGVLPDRRGRGNPNADYGTGVERDNESYSGYLDYVPTDKWLLSVRAGQWETDYRDVGIPNDLWIGFSTGGADPRTAFPDIPAEFQNPRGWANIPSNVASVQDIFQRRNASLEASWFPFALGSHILKAGVQLEEYENDVLSGYSNSRILYYWDRAYTTSAGEQVRGEYGYFRLLKIATQGQVSSENTGLFIQDSWTLPNNRLTLNIGVRAEEENVPSYAGPVEATGIPETAIAFDYDDKLAPRLGFAYDVTGDGRWKAYGSYGVFYDITKLEMPRGSFGGDKWIDHFYTLDSFDWKTNECFITNNLLSDPVPQCPAGQFIEKLDRRHPSNNPEDPTIDPNLKPMESLEYTLGLQHELTDTMMLGFRYTRKELVRTIEDVGVLQITPEGSAEVYFIANPGRGIATDILGPGFPSQPEPVREYDGFELEFAKRFLNNWSLHATYLYSELFGNYGGLASSDELSTGVNTLGSGRNSPNVNRYFDSLAMSFDQSGDVIYGKLATDRPHQFKVQAQYLFPFGTNVGMNQYVGSGTPVTSYVPALHITEIMPFGRGDMGRTPTLTQTDLLLSHEFRFAGTYALELSVNVLNLFDEDTEVAIWNVMTEEELPLSQEEFFAGFDARQLIAENDLELDPRYGKGYAFQAPREVRFGAKFRF